MPTAICPSAIEMRNQLTDLLDVDVPVIGAPMAGISGAALAAAVAKAGGLGLIGAGYIEPARLSNMYRSACLQLEGNFATHRGVGIGLINFACSEVILFCSVDCLPALWLGSTTAP